MSNHVVSRGNTETSKRNTTTANAPLVPTSAKHSREKLASIPRLAAQVPGEAAEMLGVSPDFFDQHVRPELKIVYRGRLRLVAVTELQAWLERSAMFALDDAA